MAAKLSGKNFDVNLGDNKVHVEAASLSITDNSTTAQTRGVPNGWVDGDVAGAGELELDHTNFLLVVAQAKSAGSFRELEPFDIVFFGKVADEECRIEAFGCKLRISDLLNIDPKGGAKTTYKLPYDVTSPDFIKINGVPYLSASEIEDLT